MFSLSSFLSYHLYSGPTDMRKSFDGLCGLVTGKLGRDPTSGEVFVFINKDRNRIKLLHWESGGFVLYYKRLEAGTFEVPVGGAITWSQLMLIVEGISMKNITLRRRFHRENNVLKMAL